MRYSDSIIWPDDIADGCERSARPLGPAPPEDPRRDAAGGGLLAPAKSERPALCSSDLDENADYTAEGWDDTGSRADLVIEWYGQRRAEAIAGEVE
jgi:hypothetical protein